MRYETGQFGSFDGLDNRRELMSLFVRMGEGLNEQDAAKRRAKFLMSLIGSSTIGFKDAPMQVTPCNAVSAYHIFIAITGCCGVDVNVAATKLERLVQNGR